MAYKTNYENRMDLDNPKDKLEKLVRSLFYIVKQRGGDMFLEYMKEEISKYVESEGNKSNSKPSNCAIFDISQQRELLVKFANYCNSFNIENNNIYEEDIDDFLNQ